ncbi:hypothetical protein [Nostoc sp.]|uniref:hypothetical protein n=1 Tax=Nostoc sp. TaxID=1180 RepID=UPI002FF541FA
MEVPLRGTISRSDFRAIFDPENGIVKETATLRTFSLKANPLKDYAPVVQRFSVTGQRVKPGQSSEGD